MSRIGAACVQIRSTENWKILQRYCKDDVGYMYDSVEYEKWRADLRVINNSKTLKSNKYMRYWETRKKDMCFNACDNQFKQRAVNPLLRMQYNEAGNTERINK